MPHSAEFKAAERSCLIKGLKIIAIFVGVPVAVTSIASFLGGLGVYLQNPELNRAGVSPTPAPRETTDQAAADRAAQAANSLPATATAILKEAQRAVESLQVVIEIGTISLYAEVNNRGLSNQNSC
jgi:hypothetical protein